MRGPYQRKAPIRFTLARLLRTMLNSGADVVSTTLIARQK
jgi:hypothetical protein